MPKVKAWRNERGELFHDECFDEGESRNGFTAVDLNEVDDGETCEVCGGEVVVGREAEIDNVDDEDEDDEQAP